MRTIETTAVVTPDHTITVTLPADIPPGQVQLVVVVEERTAEVLPFGLRPYNLGLTDPNCTFRREDMYGDDGR